MRLIQLTNAGQLGDLAGPWDALWSDSDVASPAARAALIQLWLGAVSPRSRFHGLAVEQYDVLLAALPLVQTRVRGVLAAAGVVGNCWSAAGQLLVHPAATDDALDLLVHGIDRAPLAAAVAGGDQSDVRRLAAIAGYFFCDRIGTAYEFRHDRDVGLIDITHDWPAYQASWTRNHARNLHKARRRLEQAGEVACVYAVRVRDEAQAETLLVRALDIEERSWKARRGTSVASHQTARSFITKQVRQLASWDAVGLLLSGSRRPLDRLRVRLSGQGCTPGAFEDGFR